MSIVPVGAKKRVKASTQETVVSQPQADVQITEGTVVRMEPVSLEAPEDDGSFYKEVPLDRCIPNDWNPNKMTTAEREKLRNGMKDLLRRKKKLIPLAVRRHPSREGYWQIIDGENRWDELRQWATEEFGVTTVSVVDYEDLPDEKAMELTSTLNYNRGSPDPDRYVLYLKRYLETSQKPIEAAAAVLPETEDEIRQYLDAYDIQIDHLNVPVDEDEATDKSRDGTTWLELKFNLPREAAEVVEQAIARVSSILTGKNIRGRALELICADSLGTPLEAYGESEKKVTAEPEQADDTEGEETEGEETEEVEQTEEKADRAIRGRLREAAK